jgi:hypothetical protein
MDRLRDCLNDIENEAGRAGRALDNLESELEERCEGDEWAGEFFGKAKPCFERLEGRRQGFTYATPEEEDIKELIELFKTWRANNG